MDWTTENIILRARKFSGRLSATSLTDTEILSHINEFYQNELPDILGVHAFVVPDTFTLTADDGDYNIDTDIDRDIHVISKPVTVDDNEVTLYTDPEEFYQKWPTSGDPYESGDVEDVLIVGRSIVFRPPPSAAVVFKFFTKRTVPPALVALGYPSDRRWGKLIAAGAAKLILETNDEDTTNVTSIIAEQKTLFTRAKIQTDQHTRTSKREL